MSKNTAGYGVAAFRNHHEAVIASIFVENNILTHELETDQGRSIATLFFHHSLTLFWVIKKAYRDVYHNTTLLLQLTHFLSSNELSKGCKGGLCAV